MCLKQVCMKKRFGYFSHWFVDFKALHRTSDILYFFNGLWSQSLKISRNHSWNIAYAMHNIFLRISTQELKLYQINSKLMWKMNKYILRLLGNEHVKGLPGHKTYCYQLWRLWQIPWYYLFGDLLHYMYLKRMSIKYRVLVVFKSLYHF